MNTSTGWVMAKYSTLDTRDSPYDFPLFADIHEEHVGRGRCTGRWKGSILIPVAERSEVAALESLLNSLDQLELPYEPEARAVLHALAFPEDGAEWECLPFDSRPHKKRRKRHTWLDHTTGKRVNIYPESGKRHADPDCICAHCCPELHS
jgi:hypothetical protein